MYINVHNSIVHNRQRAEMSPSVDEWVNTCGGGVFYTRVWMALPPMEYHSVIKRTELLIRGTLPHRRTWKHCAKWKKPDTQTVCSVIPFMWNVQNRQICRDRKQICGCFGLGWGKMGRDWGIELKGLVSLLRRWRCYKLILGVARNWMRSVQKVVSCVLCKTETFTEEDTRYKKHCT